MINKKIYYLASPYSHLDKEIQTKRVEQTMQVYAELIKDGWILFSPIIHNYLVADKFDFPHDYNFWKDIDETFIAKLDGILVLRLPGWEYSKGVQEEIKFAESMGKQIIYLAI